MATRILGMGDVVSLVERAQDAIDLEEAQALEQKVRKNQFTLEDFMKIQRTLKKLGSLEQILGMLPIPGIDREMKSMLAHTGEAQFKRIEAMIQSMTPQERQQPDLIVGSRKKRIAKGCGMPETEIVQFLQQFEMMRGMMKGMTQMGDAMKGGQMPKSLPPGMGGKGIGGKAGAVPDWMKPTKKKQKKSLFPPFQ